MAKNIVWRKLRTRLTDLRWVAKANETELSLELVNGSMISLKGADNFDSLRGVANHFLVLDEFAFMQPEAWHEVLRPTLSDTGGHAMFISTPVGRGNWAYDMFIRSQQDPENWGSWQFTSLDGGRIPSEEIAQARLDLDARTFRQEYEASFESYSGRIYYGFDHDRNIRPWSQDIPRSILLFCDFNVSPVSAAVAVQTPQGIHIIDEIVMHSSNTDELVQEVRNRYPTQAVTAYPDPAGAQRKTSAGGRTDISILQNAGFSVKYHRQHPAVRDRINAVNSALCNSAGEARLWIDPRCRTVIECLDKHAYKPGTQIPDKNSGFDHMSDAVGYGVEYIMPVRREVVNTDPGRWTNRSM